MKTTWKRILSYLTASTRNFSVHSVQRGFQLESLEQRQLASASVATPSNHKAPSVVMSVSAPSQTSPDQGGNNINLATPLTLGATVNDWVGLSDADDFYRISVPTAGTYRFDLDGMSADADLYLYSANGGTPLSYSNASGSSPETVQRSLSAGTYYLRVMSFSGASTNYRLHVAAPSNPSPTPGVNDWFSQNLSDAGIIIAARNASADHIISRGEMIDIFRASEDDSIVNATEVQDLRRIVASASALGMPEYVRYLAGAIVNGVASSSNSSIDLMALPNNSSAATMEARIGKWFLGTDRPSSSYPYAVAQGQLFVNGAQYTDVTQGNVGDCYFIGGLMAIASNHSRTITDMFIDNGDNTWTVRFYDGDGHAEYVTVDRYLPSNQGRFAYANPSSYLSSSSNELWGPLAERAFVQWTELGHRGTAAVNAYDSITGGYTYEAFRYVANIAAPVYTPGSAGFSFNYIVSAVRNGHMVTFGTRSDIPAGRNWIGSHLYAVVGYNASNSTLVVANPWGASRTEGRRTNWAAIVRYVSDISIA